MILGYFLFCTIFQKLFLIHFGHFGHQLNFENLFPIDCFLNNKILSLVIHAGYEGGYMAEK